MASNFFSNKYLSVMLPAASSGSVAFKFQTFNSQPSQTFTVTVTGISAGDSEQMVAYTICNQASSYFGNNGILFTGVIGSLSDPVCGVFQTAFTEHVVNFFSPAQFSLSQVSDTTGSLYKLGTSPALTTVLEASAYGPINNQGFQTCSNGSRSNMTTSQMADLILEASSDLTAIMKNNIVSSYYIYEFTTTQTNALRYPNRPVNLFYYPYVIRPVLYPFTSITNTFDFPSNYYVDRDSGYITFRFAQDILFNYEPFDFNNQFRSAYGAGTTYIPEEIKTAVLRWIWVIQNSFTTISKVSDGQSEITYGIDKNIEKRTITANIWEYMQ